MTAQDVWDKMDSLRITRDELARRIGAFPHSLTNFRDKTFTMTEQDANRLVRVCDEIVEERINASRSAESTSERRKEVAA